MALEFAVDRLTAAGWASDNDRGCSRDASGRLYPSPDRVQVELSEMGLSLDLTHLPSFGCYRARFTSSDGEVVGEVVGSTEEETAVYALARAMTVSLEPSLA